MIICVNRFLIIFGFVVIIIGLMIRGNIFVVKRMEFGNWSRRVLKSYDEVIIKIGFSGFGGNILKL